MGLLDGFAGASPSAQSNPASGQMMHAYQTYMQQMMANGQQPMPYAQWLAMMQQRMAQQRAAPGVQPNGVLMQQGAPQGPPQQGPQGGQL